MAIANRKTLNDLLNKTENEGTSEQGRLTSHEWNSLVDHVIDTQTMANGAIKGIKYNGGDDYGGQTFSEIDAQGYLKMTVADKTGYSLAVNVTEKPLAYIAKGSKCPISLNVSHKKVEGNGNVPATRSCIVHFYLNDSNNPFYTTEIYDKDSTEPNVTKQLTIDLSTISGLEYNSNEKENTVKIEVNNREGTIKNEYCIFRIVEFDLYVDRFNIKNVYNESDKPQLIVRVSGTDTNSESTGEYAYVTAAVDGINILERRPVLNGTDTNFGQDIFNNANTHGIHKLEVYASVIRSISSENSGGSNETITISTPIQSFNYIYGTTSSNPIVMSVIKNTTPEEYSNFEMSYIAYKYNSTSVAVKDTITVSLCEAQYVNNNGNQTIIAGKELITISQEATFDVVTNSAKGDIMFSLFPINNVSLIGKKAILISIGNYKQVSEIEIKKSSVTLNQLGGYAVYLTANNRSNNEPIDTIRTWKSVGTSKEGNTLTVNTIFEDNIEFINTGSGWIADSDGNMAMHLRKGRFFNIDYQPFNDNPTYNDSMNQGTGRGKTISIEFATRNCLNQNSPVISCLDSSNGNERGFEITASKAVLKANTFELNAEFKEDTRIRIDFVIEGKKTTYNYNTVSGKDGKEYIGSSDEALAIIYVDGVYQALKVIPTSTTFRQGNSKEASPTIRFGSNDCDLDIYSIRIYNQALTPIQIVNNYSYDTPKFIDKIEIAKRNNIFDSTSLGNKPNINISSLRDARPDLPFFFIKQNIDENTGTDEIIPMDKSNWKKLKFSEWRNPKNPDDITEAAISWTTEKGRWRNQGTSSMSYPWPWRNWDWQLKDGEFKFGNNTTGTKWPQYKGMADAGSIKKITLKKDYASSEMCNNAITSEYFTDMALAVGDAYPNVLSPAQRILGPAATPFRLTFVATPCFLFQQFNDPSKIGSAGAGYEALGMMNLIPNKNECDHLGFGSVSGYKWKPADGKRAQSWELADNMDDWFWYKKLKGIIRNSDGTYTNDLSKCYEARYPKDSTLNDGVWDMIDAETREESDFGMVVEDKPTITDIQREALYNEQKDIIELHNWLVDVNRQIPIDYYNGIMDYDETIKDYVLSNVENPSVRGEYRLLTAAERDWDWNKNEDGSYNQYDTPEYRLAKFKAEAPTRLIVDQFLLYYIWRETFWAFDSGFKNLQVYTMDKANSDASYMQWGCMVRDADTTLGIENTGKKIFPAHIEDVDYYEKDEKGNITFNYGGAKNLYHNKEISARGGHAVLNGQLGSLWVNLRDSYGARIAELYRTLANTTKANWNSSRAIDRFRKHQEKWCESLYNFGMRQYFGGEPFTMWIESGLGDKKNSRASWLDRAFYYRNSKYNNLNDYCAGRIVCYHTPDLEGGHTENHPLKFKSYMPMYIGIGAHEQRMTACQKTIRVTDIENTFDVLPGKNGLDFAREEGDDTVTWFFGTDQLTELGDLARCCKVKTWQYINLPKLRELNLGHEKDRDNKTYYEYKSVASTEKIPVLDENNNHMTDENGELLYKDNTTVTLERREFTNQYLTSMDCSSLKQLTLLDVTNHKMLSTLNLTACDQLQKLYARGTDALTSIDLPATTALNTIYLGKNLVTLNITNLTSIENFVLEGANSIEKLYIRNSGPYMAGRSYDIMKMAISSLENIYDSDSNNNICILEDIKWTAADVQYIEKLLNINATLSGEINITTGILTNDLKIRLVEKYGDIDDQNNGLYISYRQIEITSASIPSKLYIYTPGTHKLAFSVSNPNANTYKSAIWSLSPNSFAGINENTGVLERYNDTEEATENDFAELTVTIKQIPKKDGTQRDDITLKSIIYFYERLARIGDIVFNDGSFSDELDPTKTPIGVCFYIDPLTEEEKNNNIKQSPRRLMCSCQPIYFNNYLCWGYTPGKYINSGQMYEGPSPLMLNDSIWGGDISKLSNINTKPTYTNETELFSDNAYRDESNSANNYFKSFNNDHPFGNIGWTSAVNNAEINVKNNINDKETKTIRINKQDFIPEGYYNTIVILEQRNKLLDSLYTVNNPGDTNEEINFEKPTDFGNISEYNYLTTLLQAADSWLYGDWNDSNIANRSGTQGNAVYYPAASYCFAYQPVVSNLADKFKKHNWFLPSSGELARILYYIYQSFDRSNTGTALETPSNSNYNLEDGNAAANAFYNIFNLNKFETTNILNKDNFYFSSTEYSGNYDIMLNYFGAVQSVLKYNEGNTNRRFIIIPICIF